MEKFKVIIKSTAKKDMAWHKKAGNQAVNKKNIRILEELQVHPFTGTGKPEPLKNMNCQIFSTSFFFFLL